MPMQAFWRIQITWIKGSDMTLELDRSGFESQLNHFSNCDSLSKVYNLCKPHLSPFVGIHLDAESILAESIA